MTNKRTLTSLILQERSSIIIGLLGLTIVDAALLCIPLVIERAIDSLSLEQGGFEALRKYGLILIGLGVFMSIFRFVWRYFLLGASRRVEQRLRNQFFFHLERLSFDFFSKRNTGDLMAHTVNDIEAIRMACGLGLVIAYDGVLLLIFIILAMLYVSPMLTMYIFLPFPFLGIMIFMFGKSIEKRFQRVQDSFSILTESARLSLSAIKVVKAQVREKEETGRFDESSSDYVHKNLNLIKITGVYQPLIAFIAGLAFAIFLYVGGRSAALGEITLGEFSALLVYLAMLAWPMIAVGWAVDIMKRGSASLNRVNDILDIPQDTVDSESSLDVEIKGDLEFKNLRFSYPDGHEALQGISFRINSGEAFGITGATAAGKTTLLELISRVKEPDNDQIYVNCTTDIKNITLSSLRKGIVYVPQESLIFSGTIRDNISFMNDMLTEADIVDAAKLAGIYEDILEFPEGFDTMVGERGLTVSGGQRQRLALARALLLAPRILILDDVLSSLDIETESKVLANLRKAMKGKTLVVVSSRVPSISGFDKIAVLDSGELVELGNHEELIQNDGIYAKLYNVQTIR